MKAVKSQGGGGHIIALKTKRRKKQERHRAPEWDHANVTKQKSSLLGKGPTLIVPTRLVILFPKGRRIKLVLGVVYYFQRDHDKPAADKRGALSPRTEAKCCPLEEG